MLVTSLISVVTVTSCCGVVYQKIFVNDPNGARRDAARFERENKDKFYSFDWQTTVRDY